MARPRHYNLARWIALVGGLGGAALMVAAGKVGDSPAGASWLKQAITSRSFLSAAGIAVFCATGLAMTMAVMWKAGARARSRSAAERSQEGAALLEFVLIFPFGLMMVLLLIQASLLMAGNLCVHYAAFCAARTATTTVPLNEQSEPPNFVDRANINGSSKMRRIKMAAVYAIMPVSSGDDAIRETNLPLQDALEAYFGHLGEPTPYWVRGRLGRQWQYADTYTTVDLAPPALQQEKYSSNEDIVVTVNHTFYLAVPYARRIFSLGADGATLDLGAGAVDYGTKIRSTCTLTNEGVQDYVDIEHW